MQQRRKKKQKRVVEEEEEEEEEVVHATTTTTESVEYSGRNWLELPGLPLHSVVDRLAASPDPLDLLSFASVCSHWHAFAASATPSLAGCPDPFLLLPSPVLARYRRCQNPRTLALVNVRTLESFPCRIPSRTLALPCAGYSRGHLVFLPARRDVVGNTIVLANVFSGRLRTIRTPPDFSRCFRFALITDTDLLLLTASYLFRYHHGSWSRLDLGFTDRAITSLAVVRDRVYCLDSFSHLLVLQLGAEKKKKKPRWKPVGASPLSGLWSLSQHLVECGGELLLLNMASSPPPAAAGARRVWVYKLEPETSEWAEVGSLGDWCVFVDPMGSCPAACRDPARWGGRSNCVYVAVPPGCSCDGYGWMVVPLDGDEEVGDAGWGEGGGGGGGGSCWGKHTLPPWPSPLWVFPRTLCWPEKHTL